MSNEDLEGDVQVASEDQQEQPASDSAELAALHAEVEELRRQVAKTEATQEVQRHRGRAVAVGLLIVLGCLVLVVANLASWLRGTVLDTDDWVAAVGPLSRNEVIVNTLSGYVTAELFKAIDVERVAQQVLPEEVGFLSTPLANALHGVVRDAVATVIMSDQFNAIWVTVNRTVHGLAMGVLRFDGGYVSAQGGQLTLDLSGLFEGIQSSLGLAGLGLFGDEGAGKFVLLQSHQVAAVQQALSSLNAVGLILPWVALAILVIAWLLSLTRRRTLLWIGVGVAISMVLSLLILALAQPAVLASIADPLIRTLMGEIWDTVIRGLIVQTIVLLVIGLLIAAGAALAGPHPRAVAIRSGARDQIARVTQ
jgi:hypothetical protein